MPTNTVRTELAVGHRPIPWRTTLKATLAAFTAVPALIPIARQAFWEQVAYALMGGIIAGTAITLLFPHSMSPGSG